MTDLPALCRDLGAEHASVDGLVAPLDEEGWATPTPAAGWTVRDQVAHLTWFDLAAVQALTDEAAFAAAAAELAADPTTADEATLAAARAKPGAEVLADWRQARAALLDAAGAAAASRPSARVPWYGPPMSLASFLTARLMETWAHGEDVATAVGVRRPPTDRLRHIAHLGVRARAWSYRSRGMPVPDAEVRVELDAPSGEQWTWGGPSAAATVRGPALDFCLVVTRRRHPADTALVADGPLAEEWLPIAQAYAGPPTDPPPPSSR